MRLGLAAGPRPLRTRAGLIAGIPALAVAAACALAQAPPAGKGPAVVPFTMLPSNHMLVKAKINGKGPYRLIFDLGAPITLLGNRAGEGAGVIKPDAPRSFLMGMRGEAQVDKLEVGGLTATKLPVIVFDHPALKVLGDALGEPLDGIIGFTFFARYRTTIDYQKDEMTFEPVDFRIRDLMKELPDRLAGPREAARRVLAPRAVWGLRLGEPKGGVDSPGVPIREVLPGSPAAAAGLKPGDVMTTLGDRWTTTVADVFAAAGDAEPGKDARVVVLRDGKELALTVRPADGA
ncbi:serine endoprotease [Aquisphaera giovannonii]|uniref:Serine endoprotease n=1 Tax=Aquisphaera giovannonii TaxID=406548 RepID=A0A5B9WH97_9BACT|nr:PDZ domain-containing protein [Aquisphaera giovannonii]QEH39210.1 serine endoprotease [Aquisphaera giovannonii]